MAKRSGQRVTLLLTHRAIADLAKIEEHSRQQWGQKVAERYLDDLQAGLDRIRDNPSLLHPDTEFSPGLYFYRVGKHLFACDVQPRSVNVLTVVQSSMDIPARLQELEPLLSEEIAILRAKLTDN